MYALVLVALMAPADIPSGFRHVPDSYCEDFYRTPLLDGAICIAAERKEEIKCEDEIVRQGRDT